ncbi:BlaI/MecI/CopY family transcriptional regulator [Pseudonocardia sp. KRD291]|uniref:BlaI/MecI/CopY family transcriptional regulator n=1 Tax=Pseudonocardia sp. KRD291 TaxID=2792007 RepID=UPI001C4A54AE|nr:BlaI/MecI/CopY family transcriptional regulator [Pseudonocardia sp. KRD291]MBW0106386.1 BlaI/MecI/CopY family transcriptional regulator [Pseudonocardia sp. KRD291]
MRPLGVLEGVVMDQLWSTGGAGTVREVLARLREERDLAYTTVLSTMQNLMEKGYLSRSSEGRAHRYHAVMTQAEYAAGLMQEAMVRGGDGDLVLLQFVERLPDELHARLRQVLEDSIVSSGDKSVQDVDVGHDEDSAPA